MTATDEAERSGRARSRDFTPRFTFTVFTPTYNRAHTLARVYESLRAQSFRDFEWLVVDDGSTDGTDALIASWANESDFPIRYLSQENQGKHVAFNRGVREARGALFLTLDSDDACVPTALERFKHHWDSIPSERRHEYSAVTALCMRVDGSIVGDRFPQDVTDSNSLDSYYRLRVRGEKWGFQRTDVLRHFPYPDDIGKEHIAESVVWTRIARRYTTRYVNEALRIYYCDQLSLSRPTASGTQLIARRARGIQLRYEGVLSEHVEYIRFAPREFLIAGVLFTRASLHAGTPVHRQPERIRSIRGKLIWSLAMPFGVALYARDRRRLAGEAGGKR